MTVPLPIPSVLVFWTVLYEVFFYTGYGFVKRIPHEPTDLALFVMSACNTVYYFFLCLMVGGLIVTFIGSFFRGPGWNWRWPWEGIFFNL